MKYITESTDAIAQMSNSARLRLIHENVRKIKRSEKMGAKYMQKWEELAYAREDGKLEGKAEGEKLKLISQVCKKLGRGENADVIAKELEEELSDVERICRIAEKYAPAYGYEKIFEELNIEKRQ